MQRSYTVNMAGPKESNDDLDMLEVLWNSEESKALGLHSESLQR
jgi:hypothetical protein